MLARPKLDSIGLHKHCATYSRISFSLNLNQIAFYANDKSCSLRSSKKCGSRKTSRALFYYQKILKHIAQVSTILWYKFLCLREPYRYQ